MPGRTRSVPAALRPKAKPAPPPEPATPPKTGTTIHVTIVVPDPRFFDAIRDKVFVVGPMTGPEIHVEGHVVLDDPSLPVSKLGWKVRQALAELDLVDPIAVGFRPAEQITLGWPTPED